MSNRSRTTRRRGFSLPEVMMAILIGSVLTGMAIRPFGEATHDISVRSALETLAGLVGKARARAIERGTTVELRVFMTGDSVALWQDGQHLESHHFVDVDLQSTASTLTLCMNPRGFGDADCSSFSTAAQVQFVRGASTDSVTILPLGQVIR